MGRSKSTRHGQRRLSRPTSPTTSCLNTSGEENRGELASPCLDLDGLSSSDDDIGTLVGLDDLSVTLLCGSDGVFPPVNSDQVLSDRDFPPEPVSHDRRQVVCRRDASPGVLLVDATPVRRPGGTRRSIAWVPPGKRMLGEVSRTISPVPPSLDMTVTCTSGVVPMPTQPPADTTVPAMSAATVTSPEVDVRPGPSRVRPLPRLGLASISVGERVPAVVLSFTPRSVPTVLVPRGDGGPAIPPSVLPDFPTPSSSLTSSGQSATPSSQTMAWGDVSDSSVPLSPNRVRVGHSQDVPEEGSLFHVSPVSPGFLTRPSRDAPQFPLEGMLLPSTIYDFSDSDLGAPLTYAQCELIPGSDAPMSLPVFSMPSGFCARPDQSLIQTVLALGTYSNPDGGSSAVAPPMDMEDNPLLETGLPGARLDSRCTADGSSRMEIRPLAYSFITHGSWSLSVRRGRRAS